MAFNYTFIVFLTICVIGSTFGRSARQSDETNGNTTKTSNPTCRDTTPCGWAVYKKDLSKEIEYFMKNQCTCETGTHCVRYRDDISVSAFVYRCIKQ